MNNFFEKIEKLLDYALYINLFLYFFFMTLNKSALFYFELSHTIIAFEIKINLLFFILLALYYILKRKFSIKISIILCILFAFTIINYYLTKNGSILTLLCFAVIGYNKNYNLLIKCILFSLISSLAFVIGLRVLNLIPDSIEYVKRHDSSEFRQSLGFVVPNAISYQYFTIVLFYVLLRNSDIKNIELFLIGIIALIFYYFTETRNGLITSIIIIAFVLCFKFNIYKNSIINILLQFCYPICALFTFLLLYLYSIQNNIAIKINSILSGRLNLELNAIKKFGINFFGKVVNYKIDEYDVVDSGYIDAIIRVGYIMFILIIIIYTYYSIKTLKSKCKWMIIPIVMCAYYSIFDTTFINPCNNPFILFYFFVIFDNEKQNINNFNSGI